MRSRRGRAFFFGNLLLMLGVALFGAAVSAASSGDFSPADLRTVAATEGIAPAALPPLVQSPPFAAAATPTATQAAPPAVAQTTPAETATPAPATPTSVAQVSTAATTPTPAPSPTPTAVATPEPTPAPPTPAPRKPSATHISIPSVGIDTKIVEVGYDVVTIEGQQVIQWQVADYAAGHNDLSANPGEGGNVVLSGHDDWRGEVFRTLEHVKVGDDIVLTTPDRDYHYAVTEIYFRKEVGVPLEERLATGTFLAPTTDERVTLVTCWPYGIDDHRIIVVAKPVG